MNSDLGVAILATLTMGSVAIYWFFQAVKARKKSVIFQEHWDLSDKLWEMFKDDAPYEELREFMPICRYSDERIRRHYPQILNMANLEERLARLLIDELEETGQ